MKDLKYHILTPNDTKLILQISEWYFLEWKIPIEQTLQKLTAVTSDDAQFHVVLVVNGVPVCTGGVHRHVSLIDKVPRFAVYKNWLALVNTIPGERKTGYGTSLCKFIEEHARKVGMVQLYLFTDTAEKMYAGLRWRVLERLHVGARNLVIMEKDLREIS